MRLRVNVKVVCPGGSSAAGANFYKEDCICIYRKC